MACRRNSVSGGRLWNRLAVGACLLALGGFGRAQDFMPGVDPDLGALGRGLTFIENEGQWPDEVRFSSCFGRAVVRVDRGELFTRLQDGGGAGDGRSAIVRFGLSSTAEPEAVEPLGDVFHFLVGNEPSRWRRFVGGSRGVRFGEAWPGVELVLRGERGAARWTLAATSRDALLAAGIRVDGHERLDLRGDGAAVLDTSAGTITLTAPRIGGLDPGTSAQLVGRWELMADRLVPRFQSGSAWPGPVTVEWATFFGGNKAEYYQGVVAHDDGSVTAAGWSTSNVLPTTPGAVQETQSSNGKETGFVTRFAAGGSQLIYATFLGGSTRDLILAAEGVGMADVIVAGESTSLDFPVTEGAFDTTPVPGMEGFVTRLSEDGSELVFSGFLGGGEAGGAIGGLDSVSALAIDSQGRVVAAGFTMAGEFPSTPGVFQPQLQETEIEGLQAADGFVAVISADGTQLLHATYLGGAGGQDNIRAVTVLPDDSIVVVGDTRSEEFPTTQGVIAPDHHGGPSSFDGFVTRLTPDLSALVFSTYLGGMGWDQPRDVAVLPGGALVVVGEVESLSATSSIYDFPITPDAYAPEPFGLAKAFLTHIDPFGEKILYSTYFGGSDRDQWPMAVAADSAGSVTMVGKTFSFDIPTTPGSLQPDKLNSDTSTMVYVARFHPDGRQLLACTYLGGAQGSTGGDSGKAMALALTAQLDVLVSQATWATDFPLMDNAAFPGIAGTVDGFIASLTLLPTGVTRFGQATPGPDGLPSIGVLSMPRVGSNGFGLTCTSAPAHGRGYLLLSLGPQLTPLILAGAAAWVDPSQLLGLVPASSNAHGWSQVRVPIPAVPSLEGLEAFAQFVWPQAGPPLSGGSVGTSGLRLVVQP